MSGKTEDSSPENKLLHVSFEIGLLLKGINSLLEIAGGFLLLYFNPDRLHRIIQVLTQHRLTEDTRDLLVQFILKITSGYTVSAQHFGFIYLESHGFVKLLIIFLLYRKIKWAYPLSILFLFLFIIYQLHRFSFDHSFWLIYLSVFDAIMIFLTWKEYKSMNQPLHKM
jgi:uncharacterized membrane protein